MLGSFESLVDLVCSDCHSRQTLDRVGRLKWLQRLGHLRKVTDPQSPLIDELFRAQVSQFACSHCAAKHLVVQPCAPSKQKEEDWGGSRLCRDCRKPISKERLEALPNAEFCIQCQQAEVCASACESLSDESCPRCGSWLHWQAPTSSLSQYRLVCRHCSHRV